MGSLTIEINQESNTFQPQNITAATIDGLIADLSAEPKGTLSLTIDSLPEWPIENQAALWSFCKRIESQRTVKLKAGKRSFKKPLDLVLAQLKA